MEATVIAIEVDPKTLEDVQHSINRMLQSLRHLGTVGLGHALSEWQVQTVGRAKPFVMRYRRARRAETKFRPHSWKRVKKSVLYQKRGGKLLPTALKRKTLKAYTKAMARYHEFQPLTTTKPILRPELVEQLSEQLMEMAAEQLKW
jgi:hypothetical protein